MVDNDEVEENISRGNDPVDNDEVLENTSRGNEWEVVSLTASAYDAAPGPKEIQLKDDNKDNTYREDDAETSRASLFMSHHFVFPPSQHENLPLVSDNSEIHAELLNKNVASELRVDEGDKSSGKDEENWNLKGLNASDDFPGIPFFEEKGNRFSVSGKGFDESRSLEDLNLTEKEQSIYSTATFGSLHNELGGSATYGENLGALEVNDPSLLETNFPLDISQSPRHAKDGEYEGSDVPCDAWWKRRAASLYAHAKEANTFWSIFIAAAVMGFVLLGQRWQQERWQVLQQKWQVSINNEKSGRILGPIARLKDVIVGGHRRGSFIRGTSSSEN